MVKNRLILIMPFLIIVLMGWMNINDSDKRNEQKLKEQQELIEEADQFIADEVYVRAEELLIKARKMNVGDIEAINQKLLAVYKSEGDMTKWSRTIENRISEGISTPEETEELLNYYMENEKYEKALNASIMHLEHIPDHPLANELKNKIMYDYSYTEYKYSQVGVTGAKMTVQDEDGLWYFCSSSGKASGIGYEYAVTYSPDGEYSAVMENGAVYAIDSDGEKYAKCHEAVTGIAFADDDSIVLQSNDKYIIADHDMTDFSDPYDYAGPESGGVRACSSEGSWFFKGADTDAKYEDIALNEKGESMVDSRAFVKVSGAYQLVNKEGERIGDSEYAAACGFIEKNSPAAVMNAEGKWGFVDRDGTLVIPYQFEEAKSFASNVAAVKDENGLWGYIDMSGREVIPCQYRKKIRQRQK